MGSVPMPVCAENATENDPCFAMYSDTMAEETLSISSPPYSSGMSVAVRPRSAAPLMSERMTAKSLASMAAERGTTSLVAKSAAVCAIWRCSSVKSSGKKQAAGVEAVMRKAPPVARVCAGAGGVVIVAMLYLFMTSLRSVGDWKSENGQRQQRRLWLSQKNG